MLSNINLETNEKYTILEQIGDGYTSIVYKVKDNETNEIKAIKTFLDEREKYYYLEKNILTKINSLNLDSNIKLYHAGEESLTIDGIKKQRKCLILEYASHGSLYDYLIRTTDGFSEIVCKYILGELIKIICALHKNGFCHRDIKLENILITGDKYILKLSDFGFAVSFLNDNNNKKKLDDSVGSEYYYAPEILEGESYDGEKVDIFCLGILIFVLMTKQLPFKEAQAFNYNAKLSEKLYILIKYKEINVYWNIFERINQSKILSSEFKDLFIKMVSYNPSERPSFDEIMNSEWMKDIKNANNDYLEILRNKMINEMTMAKA